MPAASSPMPQDMHTVFMSCRLRERTHAITSSGSEAIPQLSAIPSSAPMCEMSITYPPPTAFKLSAARYSTSSPA